MSGDLMLHIRQSLNPERRQSLFEYLKERLHVAGDVHASAKAHLLFVPVDPAKASPQAVVAAVRERGYHARRADL